MVVHFFAIFRHFSKNDKHPRTTFGAGVQGNIRIFRHFSKNDKHPRTTFGAGVQGNIRNCGTYRT